MRTLITSVFISLVWGCNVEQNNGTHTEETNSFPVCSDSTIRLFKSSGTFIPIADLIQLTVIDSTYVVDSRTLYCDTAVQLNENIFYSIISLGDTSAICNNLFVITIDEKNKKAIASKYLQPECDIDCTLDNYTIYEYSIRSQDTIRLTETTVYQKQIQVSNNQFKNSEQKEIKESYITIDETGQIVLKKSSRE